MNSEVRDVLNARMSPNLRLLVIKSVCLWLHCRPENEENLLLELYQCGTDHDDVAGRSYESALFIYVYCESITVSCVYVVQYSTNVFYRVRASGNDLKIMTSEQVKRREDNLVWWANE